MRILYIILILSLNLICSELKWVDEQINAIKPPRHGIGKSKINSTKNPFLYLKKDEEKTADKQKESVSTLINSNTKSVTNKKSISRITTLTLSTIINKSALINNNWYKIGDKVNKYTLKSINKTTVTLKYKKKKLILSTKSNKKNLKFKNN